MSRALKYPIGVETFAEIIEGGYVYVDKTEYIYRLIQNGKYYFLSRPRRFGKSLTLSTVEAYYEGRRELFEGLWLGRAEGVEWVRRPVFRLNFVDTAPTRAGVISTLEYQLGKWERQYDIVDSTPLEYSQRFLRVIETAAERFNTKVVVLMDEYDNVLVNSIEQPVEHEQLRELLRPLFAVMKSADRHIEFAMLTGVTRFSKLSVFSDLNNLDDISLNPDFAALCGITEDELRHSLTDGVREFAEELHIDADQMLRTLKHNYDGYHFALRSPDIYNPYSLLLALKDRLIQHRWFETGTPGFLVKMIQRSSLDIRSILTTEADSTTLSNSAMGFANLTALMYQTGYLTIKGYNDEDHEYILGIPNREVSEGLFRCLLPEFSGQSLEIGQHTVRTIRNAVRNGLPDEMMQSLKTFIAGIPYTLTKGRAESYFQSILYIIFSLLGFSVDAEYTTARGRIDILLRTPKYIYVMELKLDGTADEALRQIESGDYCRQFADDPRQLFRIGINFNRRTRNIERWVIA